MVALTEITLTDLFPSLFIAIKRNLKERHKRIPGDPFYERRIDSVTLSIAQALLLDLPDSIGGKYQPDLKQCEEDCGVGFFVVLIKKVFKRDRIDHILYSYAESL